MTQLVGTLAVALLSLCVFVPSAAAAPAAGANAAEAGPSGVGQQIAPAPHTSKKTPEIGRAHV